MFTLSAIPVKFVGLVVLFVVTTLVSAQQTVRPARDWRSRVSSGWHLWMSLVMLLMVPMSWWKPFTSVVPTWVVEATFVVAVGWSLVQAYRERHHRQHRFMQVGNALMTGAMVWHLAGMLLKQAHMGPESAAWRAAASRPGGELWLVALIGVPLMAWLLYSAVRDLLGIVRITPACGCHDTTGQTALEKRAVAVCGFAMNFGMFWMSTGLLVPLLPFFSYLSF